MIDTVLAAIADWPWWTLVLGALLLVRALAVLALGPSGAALRGVLAALVGAALVAQLALEGAQPALLPLHVVAGLVVLLLPWERPHPEPPPLRLGRNRRRRVRRPLARAVLAVLTVAAVLASTILGWTDLTT